jgi:peptidyl-prolyl cis-trans isomerase C
MPRRAHFYLSAIFFCLIGMMAACGRSQGLPVATQDQAPAPTSPATLEPTRTPTVEPPTATPLPLAARVNGEEITLADFEAEVSRFKAAQEQLGASQEASPEEFVLDDLIDQLLLAQAARQAGFSVSEADLQQKKEQLAAGLGGDSALQDWMASQGYTEESLSRQLLLSSEAAWMRDQVISQVPETAEQVKARQIFLYNADQAAEVQFQLQNGKDFATLAAEYDPVTAGDLGWFPRGYLTDALLEEAAFNLQPGEFSQMIETPLGYYFLQVIERDPERPLDPDARRSWQITALRGWLDEQRGLANIEILIPTE